MNPIEVSQRSIDAWNRHDIGAVLAADAEGATYSHPRAGENLTREAMGNFEVRSRQNALRMNAQEARRRITAIWHGIRKRQNHFLGSKRADWEVSPTTQLRRGVVGVIAAFVVVSLSFSAQAAEKKKIMGTNKWGPVISRTVVPLGRGDDPKHELVVLAIYRATTTSSDPDFNETEVTTYEQADQVAGTGTHRGYFIRLHKNADTDYGTYEGTVKTTFKEDGSWETTTWEGTWKVTGGTGKFKNIKGSGTSRGKATAQEALEEWEGEAEY
jgi:hypothetical protein